MTDTASLKVTGTGFLAGTEEVMQMVFAAAVVFCADPANFGRFRRHCLDLCNGTQILPETFAGIEPDYLKLMGMALSPDGIHD